MYIAWTECQLAPCAFSCANTSDVDPQQQARSGFPFYAWEERGLPAGRSGSGVDFQPSRLPSRVPTSYAASDALQGDVASSRLTVRDGAAPARVKELIPEARALLPAWRRRSYPAAGEPCAVLGNASAPDPAAPVPVRSVL